MKYSIILIIIGLLFYGCEKPPSYSVVPTITFQSMTPNTVRSFTNSNADAQSLSDSVHVVINFTDGDGDIGVPQADSSTDAFFIDNRKTNNSNLAVDSFRIPYVTPKGNIKSISGTIDIDIPEIIGRFDVAHTNWDTLTYTITIKDRAGHISNSIQTPPLYIKNN